VRAEEWTARSLPAIGGATGAPDDWAAKRLGGDPPWRHRLVDVIVDDELYVRIAGDGLVVATALGSTPTRWPPAVRCWRSGPRRTCAPLAMHGGSARRSWSRPTPGHRRVHPGYSGFDVEIDGQVRAVEGREVSAHPPSRQGWRW
jgi:hypothetical protein